MCTTVHEITMPFSPGALPADESLDRRLFTGFSLTPNDTAVDEQVIRTWNVSIHRLRRKVFVDGTPIDLTATELRLLLYLVNQPGKVNTRQQILDGLNDGLFAVSDRAVDVQISGLRKKLGTAAKHLETVRGRGYQWCNPSEAAAEPENRGADGHQSRAI